MQAKKDHIDSSIEKITRGVCQHYHVSVDSIKKRDQQVINVEVRRIIYWLTYKHIDDATYQKIGDYFDKHHSTIIHSCQRNKVMMDLYHKYAATIAVLEQKIKTSHFNYQPYIIAKCKNCNNVYLAEPFNKEVHESLDKFIKASDNNDQVTVCDITEFDIKMCMC